MNIKSLEHSIEKIVPLSNNQPFYYQWAEILYRGKSLPSSMYEWRMWYAYIPHLVQYILRQNLYTHLSINLDTQHILDDKIMNSIIAMKGLPIMLEWTERRQRNIGLTKVFQAGKRLAQIRAESGFKIALDDFGAGEDSFSRICAVQPDIIKIDGPIFHHARTDHRTRNLLTKQTKEFEASGIPVVLEWIESQFDLNLALQIGASWGQGFFWVETQPKAPKQTPCQNIQLRQGI